MSTTKTLTVAQLLILTTAAQRPDLQRFAVTLYFAVAAYPHRQKLKSPQRGRITVDQSAARCKHGLAVLPDRDIGSRSADIKRNKRS